MTLTISPSKIARALLCIVFGLTSLNVAGQYALETFGKKQLHAWHLLSAINQFDLGHGYNIPDWYQSSTLLLCALLFAAIALHKQRTHESFVIRWWLLALLFLAVSIDEATEAHEVIANLLQGMLNASGLNNFTWEIPVAVCAFLLLLSYARFLATLPRKTCFWLLVGGAIYLSGALGLEAAGTWYLTESGERDFTLALLSTAEEFLEMLGVVIFIYTLTDYLSLQVKELRFSLGETAPRSVPTWQPQPVRLVNQTPQASPASTASSS